MQKHSTGMIRQLLNAGVTVDLFLIADSEHPPESEIHQELFSGHPGIRVHAVKHPRLPYFPGHYYLTCLWQSYWLYHAAIRCRTKYDFIFAQGYTGWFSLLAKRWLGRKLPPIGVHSHGLEALQDITGVRQYLKSALAPVWLKQNIRLADANLSLGGRLDDLIVVAGGRRNAILSCRNGLDAVWLQDVEKITNHADKVRFLFVGRDSSRKGFIELNQAIDSLKEERQFEMNFIGAIPKQRQICASNVIYHGEIRDEEALREIYRSCDVLVCPSYSEGMPTVILEAMASGLSVIASDVGAISLVVDDSVGRLIPPRDAAALIDAMRKAMEEDLIPKKLAGRLTAEKYTWPGVTRSFVESLKAFLDERRFRCSTAANPEYL